MYYESVLTYGTEHTTNINNHSGNKRYYNSLTDWTRKTVTEGGHKWIQNRLTIQHTGHKRNDMTADI